MDKEKLKKLRRSDFFKASQKKEVALQMQKLGYPLDAIAAVLMESLDSVLKILAVVG